MGELFEEVKLAFVGLADAYKHHKKEFFMDALGMISILLFVYALVLVGSFPK